MARMCLATYWVLLLRAYSGLGVIGRADIHISFNSHPYIVGTIIISILQMEKQRHRDLK